MAGDSKAWRAKGGSHRVVRTWGLWRPWMARHCSNATTYRRGQCGGLLSTYPPLKGKHQHSTAEIIKYRYKECNILLLGLWVGPSHPNVHRYLEPLVDQLSELEEGIITKYKDHEERLRCVLLTFVADLPAKVSSCTRSAHQYPLFPSKCRKLKTPFTQPL